MVGLPEVNHGPVLEIVKCRRWPVKTLPFWSKRVSYDNSSCESYCHSVKVWLWRDRTNSSFSAHYISHQLTYLVTNYTCTYPVAQISRDSAAFISSSTEYRMMPPIIRDGRQCGVTSNTRKMLVLLRRSWKSTKTRPHRCSWRPVSALTY